MFAKYKYKIAAVLLAMSLADPSLALEETFLTTGPAIRVETFVAGLSNPWALAFLPDDSLLITERRGRLLHVSNGTVTEIAGIPEVFAKGQGGLLDVVIDPAFETNRMIYFSYSETGEGGNGTAVARAKLNETYSSLINLEVIFRQLPKVESRMHFGSRLVFDKDGHLFITLGERSAEKFRIQAQDLNSHLGKIVRIRTDGTVPDDNPFLGQMHAKPEIWSYGHRNIQAAALHPQTGLLWEVEHGPMGGDELNLIEPGKNYGWPIVSFGANYNGSRIGEGVQHKQGMIDAIRTWSPVIAPSGMIFYQGETFPEWKNNVFIGGLASTALVRLTVKDDIILSEERLLETLGLRIRDVAEGPDGAIYLATDQRNGEVLRISRAAE